MNVTLDDFLFRLNQDDDVMVSIFDYSVDDYVVRETWKSDLTDDDLHDITHAEVDNFATAQFGGVVGFEIAIRSNRED